MVTLKMDTLIAEEEDILTFDVSDDALERAVSVAGAAGNFTWGVCTLDQAGCPA